MVYPVIDRHISYKKGIHSVETADIVAIFIRVGSALMMGINTAVCTKVMFGGAGVELIQLQHAVALYNFNICQFY